jgi:hypothetical protein
MDTTEAVSLLDLPDPCLLAVLRCCCSTDLRSLFNAGRAHSRLRQAAVAALSSISITVNTQQQIQGFRQYLTLHSSEVTSLDVQQADDVYEHLTWCELPEGLKLQSLQLAGLSLDDAWANRK